MEPRAESMVADVDADAACAEKILLAAAQSGGNKNKQFISSLASFKSSHFFNLTRTLHAEVKTTRSI